MRMQHQGGAIPPFLALWFDFGAKVLQRVIPEGIWPSLFGARGPVGLGRSLHECSGGRPKCGHLADASTLERVMNFGQALLAPGAEGEVAVWKELENRWALRAGCGLFWLWLRWDSAWGIRWRTLGLSSDRCHQASACRRVCLAC